MHVADDADHREPWDVVGRTPEFDSLAVNTRSDVNPTGTCMSRTKLRSSRPAPTKTTTPWTFTRKEPVPR
jgi:hypothetical protein